MKKRIAIGLCLCMLLLITAVGCSKTTANNATADKAGNQTGEQKDSTAQDNGKAGQSASNQDSNAEKNTPDLFGQVKSVSGTAITLAVAEMPQRPQGSGAPPQNQSQEQGGKPESAPQQSGGPQQSADTRQSGSSQQPAGLQLTGETKTITIPDGVKITAGGRDNSAEVSINDIKAGDMMQIWFNDSKDTVEQVRLMQARQDGGAAPAPSDSGLNGGQ